MARIYSKIKNENDCILTEATIEGVFKIIEDSKLNYEFILILNSNLLVSERELDSINYNPVLKKNIFNHHISIYNAKRCGRCSNLIFFTVSELDQYIRNKIKIPVYLEVLDEVSVSKIRISSKYNILKDELDLTVIENNNEKIIINFKKNLLFDDRIELYSSLIKNKIISCRLSSIRYYGILTLIDENNREFGYNSYIKKDKFNELCSFESNFIKLRSQIK